MIYMSNDRRAPQKIRAVLAALLIVAASAVAGCKGEEKPHTDEHALKSGPKANVAKGENKSDAGGDPNDGGASLKLSPEELARDGIQVEPLKETRVVETLNVTAVIRANRDKLAHIEPRVPGRIIKVMANLGDRVRPGQTLAMLDSIEVGEAQSAYLQAESEHSLARAAFDRAEKLHAEEIIAQKDYLRARADLEKARVSLRAARDKLQMLGVAPVKGTGSPSVFPLISPFAGVVTDKDAVLGELAKPDKIIFTVADLSVIGGEANIPERDLSNVRAGLPATLTVAAYPDEHFKGRVTHITSQLDKETRTVTARIEVQNSLGKLKPEMFANAAIETTRASVELTVSEEAVVLIDGRTVVYVQDHDSFEARPVQTGRKLPGRVVITSGLKARDAVVVKGAYALKARQLKAQLGSGHGH